MTSHKHNLEFFYKFNKYYGIVNTYGDLIVKIFKLNNIFYYRKKQKYGINNNINEIFELKYDTKFKFDFNNECSKNNVIYYKYFELYNYKMSQEKLYFLFIQSLTFLNKYLEKENYDILFNYLQKLSETFIFSDDEREKVIKASKFLKNLHILYLYFSNYPYLYGALTDEEIDKALSSYKPNTLNLSLVIIYNSFLNSLVNVVDVLASKVNKGISILNDKKNLNNLHKLLICINLSKDQIEGKYIIYDIIQFYQIKYYLKDIDFCLGKTILNVFEHLSKDYPLKSQIINTYLNKDKRFLLYLEYNIQIIRQKQNQIEDEKTKAYNKSIKYNHTIVLGDKKFHNLINKMKLPCENIYYLNENEFSNFFSDPKKIDGKYKICKYFIIMNEKNGKEYFETIRYMSNVFGIKLAVIVYIENKDIIINKKILENPLIHIVLAYCEKDILNYYYDSFIRLKDITLVCDNERELMSKKFGFKYDLPKLNETKIIREEDNGWDMVKDINTNFFNLIKIYQTVGLIDATSFNIDMYRVYKENNCLDLFIKYYGNYFACDYLVEQTVPMLSVIKLFIYAYTLEEKNGKSFYSLMNNDLRSGDKQKICRYLPMFYVIYSFLKDKYLKSYNGDVFRAAYFKKELIDEIKEGKKLLNASLWSSSKKLDVAKKFLFHYKKNILLHTKVKEGNNIDIHLENLSLYPDEEEVLFLPYCVFEVKSFNKVRENGLDYYKLDLIYCEEENKSNDIENLKFNDINLLPNNCDKKILI